MNAYDYTNQRWVDGREGMELTIKQREETLAILTGPRATDYAKFSGFPAAQIPEKIRILQSTVRELKRDLAGMISHENFNHSCR